MFEIIYLLFSLCKLIIKNQTPSISRLISEEGCIIKIPSHTFLKNYEYNSHPYYFIKDALFYKPLRKFHDYEWDCERGVCIEENGEYFHYDSLNIPDFEAQTVPIIAGGVLLCVLFKLFS